MSILDRKRTSRMLVFQECDEGSCTAVAMQRFLGDTGARQDWNPRPPWFVGQICEGTFLK